MKESDLFFITFYDSFFPYDLKKEIVILEKRQTDSLGR